MNRPGSYIAILDDEPQYCKAVGRLLRTHGFEVEMFTFGEELLAACSIRVPDCILLDLHMPVMSGFEVLEQLAAKNTRVPVIVVTGHDQLNNAERVRALGGADYMLKPLNESKLLAAISRAMDQNLNSLSTKH